MLVRFLQLFCSIVMHSPFRLQAWRVDGRAIRMTYARQRRLRSCQNRPGVVNSEQWDRNTLGLLSSTIKIKFWGFLGRHLPLGSTVQSRYVLFQQTRPNCFCIGLRASVPLTMIELINNNEWQSCGSVVAE